MKTHQLNWLRLSLVALSPCAVPLLFGAEAVKLTAQESDFFEKKIRPVLVENCYKCHSKGSEKVKGGLLLDSRDGLRKGGNTGPGLVPGNPDKSMIIQAVRYTDKDLEMPPNDKKLPAAQIADLEQWVKMGAPDPRTGQDAANVWGLDKAKGKKHWAYQKVVKPKVPEAVSHSSWVQTPVDNFIVAGLVTHGLTPGPKADKVTLIRRATFDLTGLPPTIEELDAYLADNSPDAFVKVVDRLLDSPRYGERWGRYWLDVARYADTKGPVGQMDARYVYSYTYRDYVIRAFNDDLPYDQFVIQQIAADKLDLKDDKRPLAALGFLTLGSRFNNNQQDIIDDRIDVIAKGTMGMTVTCARCHDHKFDPIPTKDYYSLYGVFSSTFEPAEGPLLIPPKNDDAYMKFQRELDIRTKEYEKFRYDIRVNVRTNTISRVGEYLLAIYDFKHYSNPEGMNLGTYLNQKKRLIPEVGNWWSRCWEASTKKHDPVFAAWVEFAAIPGGRRAVADEDLTQASEVAALRQQEKAWAEKAVEIAKKIYANKEPGKPINPIIARAFVNPPTSLNQVAALYSQLFLNAELSWQNAMVAYENKKKLSSNPGPAPAGLSDPNLDQIRQVFHSRSSPAYIDQGRVEFLVGQADQNGGRDRAAYNKIIDVKERHPGSPARALVLNDNPNPGDTYVFLRGNPGSRGPNVPRQFLEILSDDNRQPFKDGSGRLDLAKAIANKDNPLTARVMVNRMWLHHFGEGMVKTPNDFGTRCDPPTHPEMLDYLAWQFVEYGWSMKKMHRLLMQSAVYQQSSDENARFSQIDPNNTWYWQMNRRRLDFESMRDTILAIGGKLDVRMGGPSVRLNADLQVNNESHYSARRTVYGYVDRNNIPDMFRAFDFANPDLTTGKRSSSIVPQQALFMMNSPLVIEQARNLVRRSDFSAKATPEDKVKLLYRLIYQRAPTPAESKLALMYLQSEAVGTSGPLPGRTPWEYGFGEVDSVTKKIKQFYPMERFTNGVWQVTAVRPDQKFGGLHLSVEGGYPGNFPQQAAIRRWTAPQDGYISVDGMLIHQGNAGDGITGQIISSGSGRLGGWNVLSPADAKLPRAQVNTKLPRVQVKAGDTIDFVVDCKGTALGDNFAWAPIVKMDGREYNAKSEFGGAMGPKRLVTWEKFAQVLLETNELTFVN